MDDNSVDLNLEEIVQDDAAQAPETEELSEAPAQKEPGWYKARFAHDLERERRKWEAEQEEKLAPIYEYMMQRQAQELVDSGEFRSVERATEYLQMKQGYSPASEPEPEVDPAMAARADLLARQAEKIKANRGLDVMELFNDDPDTQQRVLSGEWDFYDVAEIMDQRTPPAPMRTSNGAGTSKMTIQNMSDDQFERLQRNLSSGKKYDMRR